MALSWVIALACLFVASIPVMMTLWNLLLYRPPRTLGQIADDPPCREERPAVSLLIPARNEQAGIGAAIEAAQQSEQVDLEIVILDDHSTDATAAIVDRYAQRDARIRRVTSPPLPDGWCGKQHACWNLAQQARHDVMVFVDADVRLAPDALRRCADDLEQSGAALVSGFPHQLTETWLEKWTIPLMHLVLLGYLPMWMMRQDKSPGFAAGCGQLMVTTKQAYEQAGGHAAIRASMHDGVTLPRAYRNAGLMTDLFDADELAHVRMYRGAGQTWQGLTKNATEGLATPVGIWVWTVLLGIAGWSWLIVALALGPVVLDTGDATGAQVHAAASSVEATGAQVHAAASSVEATGANVHGAATGSAAPPWVQAIAGLLIGAAFVLTWLPRMILAVRFRQSWQGVLAHPLGVTVLLAAQWAARVRAWRGKSSAWRGRAYPSG